MEKNMALNRVDELERHISDIKCQQRKFLLAALRAIASEYGVRLNKLVLRIGKHPCQWADKCVECDIELQMCEESIQDEELYDKTANENGQSMYDNMFETLMLNDKPFSVFEGGEIAIIMPGDLEMHFVKQSDPEKEARCKTMVEALKKIKED